MPVKKLTAELVREARRRAAAGETLKEIAADMPVKVAAVHKAIIGDTWTHVDGPTVKKGQNPIRRKMTAAMVKQARRRVRAGESIRDIVDDYPVSESGLRSAVTGDTWKRIKQPRPVRIPKAHVPMGSNRSEVEQAFVESQMPPKDGTPCHRCSILCHGRYCLYCYEEGHAPRYAVAELSHPFAPRPVEQDAILFNRRA